MKSSAIIDDGNLIVQDNSLLTIPFILGIDFSLHKITVESGSGILILAGGKITSESVVFCDANFNGIVTANELLAFAQAVGITEIENLADAQASISVIEFIAGTSPNGLLDQPEEFTALNNALISGGFPQCLPGS